MDKGHSSIHLHAPPETNPPNSNILQQIIYYSIAQGFSGMFANFSYDVYKLNKSYLSNGICAVHNIGKSQSYSKPFEVNII